MPAITSKHNSPLAAAVLALALWAGAPAQASRVATENDAIGSGLATVVHHPGSCSASSIGPYDRCAGFDFSGATLAGAQALGASQGWGPGIWNQSTDSIGTGTSTAALFDGNFGPLPSFAIYDRSYAGNITFNTELTGNFVFAMSGVWAECLLGYSPFTGNCMGRRTVNEFTAYYLFDDVILRSGNGHSLRIFLGERTVEQAITSVTMYQYQALPNPVPEPTSWGLVAVALLGLGAPAWRRRKAGRAGSAA